MSMRIEWAKTSHAIAAIAIICLSACGQASSSWYPTGKATVILSFENSDSTTKSCTFTLKVMNTGLSKIAQSSISVSVTTDAKTYFKSMNSNASILPGGSIYLDGLVTYTGQTETLIASGVAVVDQFYQ